MADPYSRAAVRAEVKRARAAGRDPNRTRLRRETLLDWSEINLLISQVTRELNALESPSSNGAGGGAEGELGGPATIGVDPPFVPPEYLGPRLREP